MNRFAIIIYILILSLPVTLLWGEESEEKTNNVGYSSQKKTEIIVDIQYKCDGAFPTLEVQRVTVIKEGEVFSRYKQRKSVEEIYKLGHFAQVEVDKEERPEGILITFLLTNKVTIKRIETIGNRYIKDDEISRAIKSKKGGEYDASSERREKDKDLIEELYKRNGYFNVKVRPLQSKINEAKKEAILSFSIDEGKRANIKEIVFRGNLSIDKEELLEQLKTRQGSEYDYQILDKDIDRLKKFYKDRGYLTMRIGEPQPKPVSPFPSETPTFPPKDFENQVEILIDITEGPKITVEFEGNDNIKDSELKKVLTLYKTNDYSDLILRRCVDDIENLYKKKGYYNVKVTKPDKKKKPQKGLLEIVITFYINEGKLFSVGKIQFEGNTAFSDKQLRSQMSTKTKSRFALPGLRWLFSRGIYDEEIFKMDLRALNLLYKQHGYREVKISSTPDETRRPSWRTARRLAAYGDTQDDRIIITINIDEGAKTTVEEVKFENSKGESFVLHAKANTDEGILKRLGSDIGNKLVTQPGTPYNTDNFLTDTALLRSKYHEQGYIYVQITPKFDRGIVTFDIVEGKQSRMGKLDEENFIGNENTEYQVLKREFLLKPGDDYNRVELSKTRRRLLALGLFSSVDFIEEVGSGEQETGIPIDVTVKVKERYAGSIGLRGGYSPSERRIRGTLEVGYNNLFRRAWRINTKLRAEWDVDTLDRAYEYEIALSEPRLFSVPILLPEGFRTGPVIRAFRDSLEEQKDAMAEGGTISLTLSGGQKSNLAFQYKYQRIEQIVALFLSEKPRLSHPKEVDSIKTGTVVSSIGFSYRRDTRNDFLYPNKGWLNHFSAEYAGGPFGGENSFYKLTTDNRYYLKMSEAVLAFAAKGGYAKGLRATKEIVSPERFRTGGSTTIRGYDTWSIGPGDVLFVFNSELRFPIYNFPWTSNYKLGGALFYDTGNVWDKINISDIPNMQLTSSFGFGLRLNTPIGPIRFDYGFPVDLSDGMLGRLSLELGHAF